MRSRKEIIATLEKQGKLDLIKLIKNIPEKDDKVAIRLLQKAMARTDVQESIAKARSLST